MINKKEEESDLKINWKAFVIISVILVSVHVWGILGGYDWISEISPIYRDMKITMTEPPVSKQCEDVMMEMIKFKNYLGIEDFIPPEKEVSFADLEYYNRMNQKIHDLGCGS